MRKIEYYCDICGDLLRKERTEPDVRPFVAFELGQTGAGASPRHRFVRKQVLDVERHLCLDCLRGLVCFAKTVISLDKEGWPD